MGTGQCYLTVLGDLEGQRAFAVGESRIKAAVIPLLEGALTPEQRPGVRTVSVDLWEGFHAACQQVLPQADLVYDRFHAAAELNEALDETRRAEHRHLRATAPVPVGRRHARSPLSGTRHWWLRPAETLTEERRVVLEAGLSAGWETARVWEVKEAFREFFEQESEAAGEQFLTRWLARARAVGNRHLTRVAGLFEQHREKLLRHCAIIGVTLTRPGDDHRTPLSVRDRGVHERHVRLVSDAWLRITGDYLGALRRGNTFAGRAGLVDLQGRSLDDPTVSADVVTRREQNGVANDHLVGVDLDLRARPDEPGRMP